MARKTKPHPLMLFALLALLGFSHATAESTKTDGEFRLWHKVTLTFEGP